MMDDGAVARGAMIDKPEDFAQDLSKWLERRLPVGYYGRVEIPIENGRVSMVKVTHMTRPKRVRQ